MPRLAIIEMPSSRSLDDGLGPLIEEVQHIAESKGYEVKIMPNVEAVVRWINGAPGAWVIWISSPEGDELAATQRHGISTMVVTRAPLNPFKVSRNQPGHLDVIKAAL